MSGQAQLIPLLIRELLVIHAHCLMRFDVSLAHWHVTFESVVNRAKCVPALLSKPFVTSQRCICSLSLDKLIAHCSLLNAHNSCLV